MPACLTVARPLPVSTRPLRLSPAQRPAARSIGTRATRGAAPRLPTRCASLTAGGEWSRSALGASQIAWKSDLGRLTAPAGRTVARTRLPPLPSGLAAGAHHTACLPPPACHSAGPPAARTADTRLGQLFLRLLPGWAYYLPALLYPATAMLAGLGAAHAPALVQHLAATPAVQASSSARRPAHAPPAACATPCAGNHPVRCPAVPHPRLTGQPHHVPFPTGAGPAGPAAGAAVQPAALGLAAVRAGLPAHRAAGLPGHPAHGLPAGARPAQPVRGGQVPAGGTWLLHAGRCMAVVMAVHAAAANASVHWPPPPHSRVAPSSPPGRVTCGASACACWVQRAGLPPPPCPRQPPTCCVLRPPCPRCARCRRTQCRRRSRRSTAASCMRTPPCTWACWWCWRTCSGVNLFIFK